MKKRITKLAVIVVFLLPVAAMAQFTIIDNFEEGNALWWTPDGSGSTAGIILENAEGDSITYNAPETEIVNPATESTTSFKLAFQWDNEVEYGGTATHLVRQHMPAANANVPERQFNPGQALEVFIYGDGSGNRFRFMTRDGLPTLEGSSWIVINWTGWKRIVWDYNDPANVVAWVNGNGEMEGENYYFDSFQITKNEDGTVQNGVLYFDDFRIVDPFNVVFNITGDDDSEIISIRNTTYDGMETGFEFSPMTYEAGVNDFQLFPGTYEYFVEKDGFITETGTFEVDDADINVDVTLESGANTQYTVTFSVFDQNDDIIPDATITIDGVEGTAGDYDFDLDPGYYEYVVSKQLYFETSGFTTVVDNNVFVNVILDEIPDVYDNLYLKWDVASTANTAEYRAETYSVWVASVADADQEFNAEDYEMVFEETLSTDIPNWEYQPRMIELSGFQSQNVRVAFRHFNSTDNDRVVIDNVSLEALDRVEEITDLYLEEDFEGGLPEGFDPNTFDPGLPDAYDDSWLPENWSAINNDTDTLNWYFAIRLEQDLSYYAHMRSQSYDSDAGALTPDNWLVTPYIELPMVIFYNVAFNVVDVDGNPITDAVVTFNGMDYDAGDYDIVTSSGEYEYEVSLEGYNTVSGTVDVGREDVEVDVTLLLPDVYEVTFIVDMRESASFLPGETDIYMTGNFADWDFAVPGTYPEQQLLPTNNVFFFTQTLQMVAGTYNYKYFDGTSLDDAEWSGEPFREIVVEGDMEVTDVFGGQVSVDDVSDAAQASIFPNPANNKVQISTTNNMSRVAVFNVSGQQVYSSSAEGTAHTINLDDFNEGIYLVQVVTSSGVATQKLQVVK